MIYKPLKEMIGLPRKFNVFEENGASFFGEEVLLRLSLLWNFARELDRGLMWKGHLKGVRQGLYTFFCTTLKTRDGELYPCYVGRLR